MSKSTMKVYTDVLGRHVIADDFNPKGLLIFQIQEGGLVSIYQDSELQATRDAFEAIEESVEGTIEEVSNALRIMADRLEGKE